MSVPDFDHRGDADSARHRRAESGSEHVVVMDDWDPNSELSPTTIAGIATVVGLGLLIAAVSVIGNFAGWVGDFGAFLVCLAYLLWFAIAGRIFWWGAQKLISGHYERRRVDRKMLPTKVSDISDGRSARSCERGGGSSTRSFQV
ncbi:hypothetical protein ABH922_004971 [Rhodococcus sp. 27YEA15]|uniref:hypothetical protein n=1 Tax=Rhodococcus sp. 27YEA15 TaxID=3156259 RepID=UPI003C7E10ED